MQNVLEEMRLFLETKHSQCLTNPDLHKEQISVYQNYIQILDKSSSEEEYTKNLGDLANFFPVAKAELMDKYENLFRFYKKFSLEEKAKLAKTKYIAAESARNHGDLVGLLTSEFQKSLTMEQEQKAKLHLAFEWLQILTQAIALPQGKQLSGIQHSALQTYKKLVKEDPTFTWEAFEKPPYAHLVFWDKTRMDELKNYFYTYIKPDGET